MDEGRPATMLVWFECATCGRSTSRPMTSTIRQTWPKACTYSCGTRANGADDRQSCTSGASSSRHIDLGVRSPLSPVRDAHTWGILPVLYIHLAHRLRSPPIIRAAFRQRRLWGRRALTLLFSVQTRLERRAITNTVCPDSSMGGSPAESPAKVPQPRTAQTGLQKSVVVYLALQYKDAIGVPTYLFRAPEPVLFARHPHPGLGSETRRLQHAPRSRPRP